MLIDLSSVNVEAHQGVEGRREVRAAEGKGPRLTQPRFCDATASSRKAGYEPAAGPVGPQPTEPPARPLAGPSMGLCPIPGQGRPSRGEQGCEATEGHSGVMRARVALALAAGNPAAPSSTREGSHGGRRREPMATPALPPPGRRWGPSWGRARALRRQARRGPGPFDDREILYKKSTSPLDAGYPAVMLWV